MVLWTQLSNLFSVQSDCPHREKFGYGGDIVATSEMAMFNFDMAALLCQGGAAIWPTPCAPTAASPRPRRSWASPTTGLGEKSGPIGWGTAHPLLLWQLYQYYGDTAPAGGASTRLTKRWIALLAVERARTTSSTTASATTRASCRSRAR